MLRKSTIRNTLMGLCNNKSYQIDENTLNLINNLLMAQPDDDAWIDLKNERPSICETVDIAMTGLPFAVHGHLLPDGQWVIDDFDHRVFGADRIAYWKPLPKVPDYMGEA